MAENLAYTTLINSLGPSNPIHTANRHSLYDDNVLFECEFVGTTNTSFSSSSSSSSSSLTSRSFLSRNTNNVTASSSSSSTVSNTPTTAVRRVLVLNDAILVCKASKDGLVILHELPWDTLLIEDCLPYSSSSRMKDDYYPVGDGPLRNQLHLLFQALTPQQLQCTIILSSNSHSSSGNSSIILYTPSYQEKLQWLSMLTNTLPLVIDADKQMEKHWIHSIVYGTIYSACYRKNIEMVKALLQYVPNYRSSSRTDSSSSSGFTSSSFDQFTSTSRSSKKDLSSTNNSNTSSGSTSNNFPIEISVNELDNEGYAPIHLATKQGSQPIVSLLLEAGALIDLTDNEDFNTSLHIACSNGSLDICSTLIVNGSNLENRNLLEQTQLSIILNKLLELSIQSDKATETKDTDTLIHLRSTEKNIFGIIELLVSYNSPLNESDSEGLYPLHRLALTHADHLVRSFIRHGANPANMALLNRPSVIKSLVSSSSNSSSFATITDHLTALHLACGITFDGDIRPLIDFDTGIDPTTDDEESSSHHISMTKIRSTMIVSLLKSGCQPNARTSQGETSLHIILRLLREITDLHSSDTTPSDGSASTVNLDKVLNPLRAELQAIASVLCTYGCRLDICDNLNITCNDLAVPLNITNKLEASYSLFMDRQAPSEITLSGTTASANPLVAAQRFDQLYAKNHGKVSLPSWKADNSSNNCLICNGAFTITRRRHHCRWCGLLVCDPCSKKRFPIPRRADDSDDDDNFLPSRTMNSSLSASTGTTDKKNVFGSLFSALSLSSENGTGNNDIDRVCDGCFNSLCTLAEISTEETQKWEQEKAQALQKSRNMVNSDKQDKATMERIKNKINEAKLTPDEERSALFARGSGSNSSKNTGSSSLSSGNNTAANTTKRLDSLQNTLNDNKAKLTERGEKLSRLDEKMRDMNAAAADFSNMASQLKKKSAWGFF